MPVFGSALRSEWMLDPAITYLNHGTVGAPPRRVLAAQQAIRDEIEYQPARFMLRELADVEADGQPAHPRMRVAAEAVATFLGVAGDDLGFVDNATAGANAVLRSFPFEPGDEVLVTSVGYGGVNNAVSYVTERAGATMRVAPMPAPGATPEQFVDAVVEAIGPRTRIALIDHISAETALLLPVAEIATRCHAQGVLVLVDGAHAPGAIPLDIAALGVDWYFGNLHKWCWAPRSAGVLWASKPQQTYLHPTVVSWGLGNGMAAEFDLLGTRDPTPFLAAPVAIEMMRKWGFEAICAYNHALAWAGAALLADRLGTDFSTPESMIGTMANVRLPLSAGSTKADAGRLRQTLWDADHIEVPVFAHEGQLTLRLSAQVYNDIDDIERLAGALQRLV
jgi:isopenicillin-N epimerase